ncbi:MAG TPA: polysaccharide biosynthesis C-terminal domain-containing protein [Acidimicrobiales bacterium]|nr:polysaccharide biosynthesis C-terminal domain-containing protein [Acidimicrobiales bacterium]
MNAEPPADVGTLPPAGVRVELLPARRASGAVLAVFALRLLGAALGMVVLALLTRQLGPDRFGELSLIFTVAIVASRVSELGTTHVVAAEMAARPERRRDLAAGLAVVRFAAGGAVALAGAALLTVLLDRAAAERAALAVMATVPLAGVTGLAVLASARLRPQVDAALSLGQSALWLACVVAAVAGDWPFAAYGLAFLVCGLAQAVATWGVVVRNEPPAWPRWRPAASRVLARSWPMAVAMVLATLSARLDGMLLFELRGPAEAGFFWAGYRFLDVFQLFPLALLAVLVPLLARRWELGDRAGVGEVFRLGSTVAAVLGCAVACAAVVAGRPLAEALFGSGFTTTGDVLVLLGLAAPALATGYVASAALVAVGHLRTVGLVALGALLVTLAADLLLIPRWGAAGAAWAAVGVECLTSAALVLSLEHRAQVRFPWSRLLRALAAAAFVVAVGWVVRSLPLAVLVAVSTAGYALVAGALGAVTGAELRALADRSLALGAAPAPALPGRQ